MHSCCRLECLLHLGPEMFQEFLAIPRCVPANDRGLPGPAKELKVPINNLRFFVLLQILLNLQLHLALPSLVTFDGRI